MSSIERFELRPGYTISRVIKGGWQLAGDHGSVDRRRAVEDMLAFFDGGITTFDCADIYTGVEEMIGEFIGVLRQERGTTAVETLKVHTKFVPDYAKLSTIDRAYVATIIDRSLQRLGLEQLNLVQFHWWDYAIPGYLDTLHILQELQQAGKIDQLGVTNFDAQRLQEFSAAGIEITSAQVQYSLLDQRPAGAFSAHCRQHHIHLLCYGVLAGGFLTDRWLGQPDPGHQLANRSLVKYRLIIDEFGGWELFQALLGALKQVAERHGVDISSVAIRTVLDQPQVAAAIVGARYARYLPQTTAAFGLQLSEEDRQAIEAVLAQRQGPAGPVYALERDKEGIHGRIMKYNLNEGD